jgi:hypothetical protein
MVVVTAADAPTSDAPAAEQPIPIGGRADAVSVIAPSVLCRRPMPLCCRNNARSAGFRRGYLARWVAYPSGSDARPSREPLRMHACVHASMHASMHVQGCLVGLFAWLAGAHTCCRGGGVRPPGLS